MTTRLEDLDVHSRITRRGEQLFQLALRMEVGEMRMEIGEMAPDRTGAEALLYLANAIAHVAALSEAPRPALKVVVRLFNRITDDWFTAHAGSGPRSAPHLLAHVALEAALGQDDFEGADEGELAARALENLIDAIGCVAALNSDPRQVLDHVKRRLDATEEKTPPK